MRRGRREAEGAGERWRYFYSSGESTLTRGGAVSRRPGGKAGIIGIGKSGWAVEIRLAGQCPLGPCVVGLFAGGRSAAGVFSQFARAGFHPGTGDGAPVDRARNRRQWGQNVVLQGGRKRRTSSDWEKTEPPRARFGDVRAGAPARPERPVGQGPDSAAKAPRARGLSSQGKSVKGQTSLLESAGSRRSIFLIRGASIAVERLLSGPSGAVAAHPGQ